MKNNWIVVGLFLIGCPIACRQIAGVDDYEFRDSQGAGGAGGVGSSGAAGGQGMASGSSSGGTGTGWSRRLKISINSATKNPLGDFPILIKLSPTSIDYAQTQGGGQDIRFISGDGTIVLAHEIEQWNANGNSMLWVNLPMLAADGNTDIYMLYGRADAEDGQAKNQVWTSGFRGVWHLHDDAISDSTGLNPGANNYGTVLGPGQIGTGRSLSGMSNEYIDTGNTENLPIFTIEAWASPTGGPEILAEGNAIIGRHFNYSIEWDSNVADMGASATIRNASAAWKRTLFNIIPAASHPWYYLVMTYDGQVLTAYKNGQAVSGVATTAPSQTGETAKIGKWAQAVYTHCFQGRIDEVRISNTARSDDWISAQYRSMADTGMVQFGIEESGSFQLP